MHRVGKTNGMNFHAFQLAEFNLVSPIPLGRLGETRKRSHTPWQRRREYTRGPVFTRGFMLDTSAINRIRDRQECPWSLRGPLYVTDIQFALPF